MEFLTLRRIESKLERQLHKCTLTGATEKKIVDSCIGNKEENQGKTRAHHLIVCRNAPILSAG